MTATRAVATVARDAAAGTFAEVVNGGGRKVGTLGRTTSDGKPLAPRLLRELFEQLGPVNFYSFFGITLCSSIALRSVFTVGVIIHINGVVIHCHLVDSLSLSGISKTVCLSCVHDSHSTLSLLLMRMCFRCT